jgi:NADPH2:quinone reductase
MQAIQIQNFGGTEALVLQNLDTAEPKAGEVRVHNKAAGVNFIDIYQRTGAYNVSLPYIPGLEGAGVVDKLGDQVKRFQPGDRVAYTGISGGYAEYICVPENRLVKIPDNVSAEQAAAVMLQGMTAHYLTRSSFPLKSGDSCLVHAAAGGVGLLLVQLAKQLGATVYGTVSTEEKAELARNAGADRVIIYTRQDFEEEIKKLTNGKGLQVVYDSVGQVTFEKSLNCLAPRGYMVLYGQSSGKVEPFDPQILNRKGSLFLTRPSLMHYIADRKELEQRSDDILSAVASGELLVHINQKFPLAEAAQAHKVLEGRKTTGKVLLII